MNHHINKCKHGIVQGQCRCPSKNKEVRIVDCSCPDGAEALQPQEYGKVTIICETATGTSTMVFDKVKTVKSEPIYRRADEFDLWEDPPIIGYGPDKITGYNILLDGIEPNDKGMYGSYKEFLKP